MFDSPEPVRLNQLSIISADSPALVAVSAMDNQTLASSQRMLIVLSTDARNSRMRFADNDETIATDLGVSPILIRANKVKLALKTINNNNLKVYSLNLKGQRKDLITSKKSDEGIIFELDISKLSHGATTYFEVGV